MWIPFGADTHTFIIDKAISRNQSCTSLWSACAWFEKWPNDK